MARLDLVWARVTPRHFAWPPRHFAWQARHKLTSTFVCVAGVAQTHIYRRFAWQAWHRWHCVARLDLAWARVTPRHFAWQGPHKLTSTVVLRGRRGTNSHLPSFCVAGVAAWTWFGRAWRRGILRGRRGTNSHLPSFCMAGAAQTHMYRRFAWQARHGRRGTNSHLPSFCVAGVAQMALRGALGLGLGARDAAAFCVAGAAQTHIYRRFAWHAWHKLTSTVVLRGRCGTDGTGWRTWTWFGRA